MSEAPVLELRNVSKVYQVKQGLFGTPKPLRAVNDVSLQLARGEVLGLVGESGCGKSTLAKILLGLEPPTDGQVLVDGEALAAQDRIALSRRIQPIFQDPYSSLNPRKSIEDIVTLPLRVHGIGDSASRDRELRRMLDTVGLPARVAQSYPSQMSGGQRQRVAIARAVLKDAPVLILDEATSALDAASEAETQRALEALMRGRTTLVIAHRLSTVQRADAIAVMERGRVVQCGTHEELLRDETGRYYQLVNSQRLVFA